MKKKMCLTASGRLLDHIGISLYASYEKGISELVINGHDSDAEHVEVTVDRHGITIKDDGMGMSLRDIEHNYCLIGGNTKRAGKSKTPKGRLPVGSKGIGKLAGFAIAHKMTVTTRKNAECHSFTLDKDKFMAARSLSDAAFNVDSQRGRGTGTTIYLTSFLPHILKHKFDLKKLRAYLAREVPRRPDFKVSVNGQICSVADISSKRRVQVDLNLPLCGHVTGTIIVAKKQLDDPGVTLTVRGRAVGKPSFLGLEGFIGGRSNKIAASRLIAGEIEVPGFDPEVEDDGMPVILSSREGFKLDHPKYQECIEAVATALKAIIRDEAQEIERAQNSKTVKEIEETLNRVAKLFNDRRNEHKHLFNEQEDERRADLGSTSELPESERLPMPKPTDPKPEPPEPQPKPDIEPVEELEKKPAKSAPGRVHIGPKTYNFTTRPLTEESPEVFIDEERSEIVLNSDHPTMAVIQKMRTTEADYLVYRMIVGAVVASKHESAPEAYNVMDLMLRRPEIEVLSE